MFSKRALLVVVCAAICLLNLFCSPLPTDGSSDTKLVELPSDLPVLPATPETWALIQSSRLPVLSDSQDSGMSKQMAPNAKIEPEKIEVIVKSHGAESDIDWDAYYAFDEEFWGTRNYNRNRWSNQVEFAKIDPLHRLVYYGALKQSGAYASGRIRVAPGDNSVLIGFVMPGDTVHNLMYAYYIWDSDSTSGWTYPIPSGDTLRFSNYQ